LLSAHLPGSRYVVVTAGFHGDEKAGPLTLLDHASDLLVYARERGVGLRLYPCANPSGFEAHTRYNTSGERPNNDFLRYELTPGVWRGELRSDEPFLRTVPAEGVPKETAALAREMDRLPPPAAALDLHQDNFIHGALFYAYIFGDRDAYRPLLRRSGALIPVLRSSIVDSGHEPGSDVRADEEGFIVCHDGSITDAYHRAGVAHTAAIETTTETPRELADAINLIWIRGFIDLVAR
jgi:predicted deacylase